MTTHALKVLVVVLVLFLAVPPVSMAGSFVVSLVQGKTPAEAVQIIAEQVDALFNRVQTLETKQAETAESIETLKQENDRLRSELDTKANVVIPPTETAECLALKAQINAVHADNQVPKSLSDKWSALQRELVDLNRGEPNKTPGPSTIEGIEEFIAQNRIKIAEYKAKKEEIEWQLDSTEVKMETYREQHDKAIAPLIEKGQKIGCLLG